MTAQIITMCCRDKSPQEFIFTPSFTRGKENRLNPHWTTAMMENVFRRLTRECGLPGRLYWLRYTATTLFSKNFSGDLRSVADLTGHKQLTSLGPYIKSQDASKKMISQFYNDYDKHSAIPGLFQTMIEMDEPCVGDVPEEHGDLIG
jgi:integrase